MKTFTILTLFAVTLALAGCENIETEAKYPTSANREANHTGNDIHEKPKSIFGGDGLFSSDKKDTVESVGISVNSFLWRASLDTISFMPLTSADPFGGTILTDWYMPEGNEKERLKVNVFILTRELRSDGIRVRVFRQVSKKGQWIDAKATNTTARQLEDAILTRARQLRVTQLGE